MQPAFDVQMPGGHAATQAGRGKMAARRLEQSILVASLSALVAVAGLAIGAVAYQSERRAQDALALAEQGRARAEAQSTRIGQQRDAALMARTRLLLDLAEHSTNDGDAGTGLLLVLETLSVPRDGAPPYAAQAELALSRALERVGDTSPALTFQGHSGAVTSATFSPDGKRLITGSADQTARIWDARTAAMMIILDGHTDVVEGATFSPDGRYAATASDDGTARIWDAATGRTLRVLAGHRGRVTSVAFSPDGQRIVTASSDRTARIWDAQSGRSLAIISGHSGELWSAAFSPDGRFVVTASSDATARIWDAGSGTLVTTLAGHSTFVRGAAFSPDGQRILTASTDNTARLWNARSGEMIKILEGHGDFVMGAAFAPDGRRVVTASSDRSARVWDSETGRTIAILREKDRLWSAAFSPDGRSVATASMDHMARIRRLFATRQELIDEARVSAPGCLTAGQREKFGLALEPPAWCIEMDKPPYATQDWKDWLAYRKASADPPLPATPQWHPWLAAHRAGMHSSASLRH